MAITKITTHSADALARLLEQFKGKPKLEGILAAFAAQTQAHEDVGFDLYEDRWLAVAVGVQLDRMGALLNEPRNGLSDDDYRTVLLAKVAQNISNATPEDMIAVFTLLTQGRYVHYEEFFPAAFRLTAVGINPLASPARILAGLNAARPAGVAIESAAIVTDPPFVFLSDADPAGRGFGSLTDSTAGGHLAELL